MIHLSSIRCVYFITPRLTSMKKKSGNLTYSKRRRPLLAEFAIAAYSVTGSDNILFLFGCPQLLSVEQKLTQQVQVQFSSSVVIRI